MGFWEGCWDKTCSIGAKSIIAGQKFKRNKTPATG